MSLEDFLHFIQRIITYYRYLSRRLHFVRILTTVFFFSRKKRTHASSQQVFAVYNTHNYRYRYHCHLMQLPSYNYLCTWTFVSLKLFSISRFNLFTLERARVYSSWHTVAVFFRETRLNVPYPRKRSTRI